MCPASATKIYSGSGIDDARAEDGAAYSKLENAFAYRERVIPDCTCTGKDIVGTVALDVYSDPTLRPGDIIVTKEGPKVFSGSERAQYRTAEFVPPENYKGLPAGVRRTLAEMRVAPELNIALADFAAQPAVPARRRLPTLAEETGHIPLGHLGLQVP